MSTRSTRVREPVSAASARFEARARAARWRARRPSLVAAAVAAVVLLLAALSWFGPLLHVRHVDVRGVAGAQAAQVRELAASQRGTPLPRADAGAVTRQVSELPYVASARVQRAWPWTLRVVVRPRVAVAAVPRTGGGLRLVDADGVPFATVQRAPSGVPVLRVPVGEAGRDALAATLTVLDGLPESLRAKVSQVSAQTPDDVQMRWRGATVVWGSAADTELKAQVLQALSRQRAAVYDVSSPHTPVLR
ncbi:MAG TPA: FtsQ-type POTRA domain-containing protein [Angustibacter sp.]|nr:FtsQ-type POTRA domain-containing protein [Angustibacter sp.]